MHSRRTLYLARTKLSSGSVRVLKPRRLPEWRSEVENTTKLPSKRLCLMGLTLGVGLTFGTVGVPAQTSAANLQTAVENIQSPQDQKIQQLQDKIEEIQKELIELKKANSAQPETHHTTTAKSSVAAANLSETEPE